MQPTVGEIFEGKITGITKFGAFVELPSGGNGLVHISEIANTYVNDVRDHVAEGQIVKALVVGVTDDGKVNLSIKKALPTAQRQPRERQSQPRQQAYGAKEPRPQRQMPERNQPRAANKAPAEKTENDAFEDKLKHFMKESDSRISSSRMYSDKKGSYRRRRD